MSLNSSSFTYSHTGHHHNASLLASVSSSPHLHFTHFIFDTLIAAQEFFFQAIPALAGRMSDRRYPGAATLHSAPPSHIQTDWHFKPHDQHGQQCAPRSKRSSSPPCVQDIRTAFTPGLLTTSTRRTLGARPPRTHGLRTQWCHQGLVLGSFQSSPSPSHGPPSEGLINLCTLTAMQPTHHLRAHAFPGQKEHTHHPHACPGFYCRAALMHGLRTNLARTMDSEYGK